MCISKSFIAGIFFRSNKCGCHLTSGTADWLLQCCKSQSGCVPSGTGGDWNGTSSDELPPVDCLRIGNPPRPSV